MKNLQNNCLDALMLNFNNYFLPVKQGSTMDLCYLHRLQWETSKIFIFPRIRVSISNNPELSAHIFLVKSENLTDAVAKGTFTKSKNNSSIDFPNSFCMVRQTCGNKIFSLANEVADANCNIILRVRGGQKVKQIHEVCRNL